MKRRGLLALAIAAYAVSAARLAEAQDNKNFTPEELDQMLAPIALYPDSLLAQVLMACTYPLEIVEAARWSKANPNLKGDAAVAQVKDKEWDTSVKSLVAFPDLLNNLSEHLDWTQKLGDAMIAQQGDVADSVQRLRAKANAAGNLKSTPQQTVTTQSSGDSVQYIIQPTNPEVIYVPQYSPSWAYGPWPYPAYPPVYYPWAGALATGFFWGLGFAAAGAMFGGWHWGGGYGNSYTNINVNRAVNIDSNFNRNNFNGDRWQHQVDHRRGVGYRDNATRQRYNQGQRPNAAQRDQFRGRLDGGPGGANRPGGGPGGGQGIANRPGGGPGGGQGIANRPGGGVQRPAQQPNRGNQRPNALNGVNQGGQINRDANRGRQQMNRSNQSFNRGGGGGGGRQVSGGGGGGGGGGGNRGGGGGRGR